MKVLIIIGHPRKDSLTAAIGESFYKGALEAGTTAQLLNVADLDFNPNVIHPTPHMQEDEPDIKKSRELILGADHVVFVYPTWWGTMPALLKGFIDRIFTSHFAFIETEGGTGYEPLLRGKTAQVITTMDTPKLIYRFIYKSPGHHALGTATLKFSGFKLKRPIRYGMVRYSDDAKRKGWIEDAYNQGLKLRRGIFTPAGQFLSKSLEWIKAIRLQFYPMTFIAYTVGALGAKLVGYGFDSTLFWLGYAWIFFAEVLTVFCNEYFDLYTDRNNNQYGPFNGGSRVLVNNGISVSQMRVGIGITAFLSTSLLLILLIQSGLSQSSVVFSSLMLLIIATGYTVPPLRLSYRGLGELTVGVTHSFLVVLCGYLYQGGLFKDTYPWLVSLPLFLSVLPSIILAGIPDKEADELAGKNTLAVLAGGSGAIGLAIFFTLASAATVGLYSYLNVLPLVFKNIALGIIPHAGILTFMLIRYFFNYKGPQRIDGLIVVALLYLMWFAVVPLLNLLP